MIKRLFRTRFKEKQASKSHVWNRLTFVVTATVLVFLMLVMAGIYIYMNASLSKTMSASAQKQVELLAAQNANVVEEYLSTASTYGRSLAIEMGELTDSGLVESRFQSFAENTLREYLNDDRIFGARMAWEPFKSFTLTPNGLSYYAYRENDKILFEFKNDYDVYGTSDYYTAVRDTEKPYLTDPYKVKLADGTSVWLMTISYPVYNSTGRFVGIAGFDVVTNKVSELEFNYGGYTSAYIYTLSNNGTFLSHSKYNDRLGTFYGDNTRTDAKASAVLETVKNGEPFRMDGINALTGGNAYILYSPIAAVGIDRALSSAFAVDVKEVMAERDSMLKNLSYIIIIGMILMYAATFLNIYRLVSPARKIAKVAEGLERGDLSVNETVKAKNEFGMIFNAICNVRDTLKELVNDTTALTEAALSGNLTYRADPEKHQGTYREIIAGVNNTLDAVIAPLEEARDVLVELSKGRLDVVMQGHYKGDHNIIKHSLNDTILALRGYISELSDALGSMAEGDFSVDIDSEYKGDFLTLKTSVNTIAESMSEVLKEIRAAADQVSAGTIQVSNGSQAISQGATEQAASIEELTASITAIAEQTRENALSANKANELSVTAQERALKGSTRMTKLQSAMTEINDASGDISKIIKVIDDIAFQTNILALNAAVEAARAGIHGKGFGVVAEEVRNLAGKSADAAKKTAALIETSVEKAETGNRIANKTAAELNGILEAVEASAKLVSDIAYKSNEQATAIAQVNKGIEQMSQVVQTNSATAEEQAATSEELSGQAEMFKVQVGRFIIK